LVTVGVHLSKLTVEVYSEYSYKGNKRNANLTKRGGQPLKNTEKSVSNTRLTKTTIAKYSENIL
jgi:hypothetical protein